MTFTLFLVSFRTRVAPGCLLGLSNATLKWQVPHFP